MNDKIIPPNLDYFEQQMDYFRQKALSGLLLPKSYFDENFTTTAATTMASCNNLTIEKLEELQQQLCGKPVVRLIKMNKNTINIFKNYDTYGIDRFDGIKVEESKILPDNIIVFEWSNGKKDIVKLEIPKTEEKLLNKLKLLIHKKMSNLKDKFRKLL